VPQMFDDEQVRHLRVVEEVALRDGETMRLISQPVILARTPARMAAPAPSVGEHSEEILREAGYDAGGIAELRESGAIG